MTLITEDWQVELVSPGILLGCNTDYPIIRTDSSDIKGIIGSPEVKIYDVESVGLDGSAPGLEAYQPRHITIPVRCYDPNPQTARDKYQLLLDTWQLIRTDETRLAMRIPGTPETIMTYFGRPREIAEDRVFRKAGLYEVTLHFDALDPYAYGEEVNTAVDTVSGLTVNNPGSVTSNRGLVRIVGNGGLPEIVNATDPFQGDVTFKTALGAGQICFLDLYNQKATINDINTDSSIWINSTWFGFIPGNNNIIFSNCTSIQVQDFRPAWGS